jgi:hypothetical protein
VRWNVDQADLEAAIRRAGNRHPGIRRLRAVADTREAAPTRSQLERAMLRLVDEAGLPRPVTNRVDGREIVDFTWPAFEDDRARDAARQARGDLVVRSTWRQVTGERVRVATRLAQTLAVRGR